MIFSDKRLPNQGELTDNMRNFDRDRLMLFNEKYVFDSIVLYLPAAGKDDIQSG